VELKDAVANATETKELVVETGAIERVGEVLRRHFAGRSVAIVADENTQAAAGRRLADHLAAHGFASPRTLIFPGHPMLGPDYANVERVREFLREGDDVPIAVGSGTINDLVKRASHELGRPYLVVATAASVDGYTSFGAALVKESFKQTLACDAPRAVVADTEVLRNAPPPMAAAGYADLAAKIPAGADWILADELGIDPIHPVGWPMVQEGLRGWLARPSELAAGAPEALGRVFTGLAFTGFAMQAMKASRPASGAEHLLSHVWEMQHLTKNGVPVSHGFKVAIGTLGTTALYEILLSIDLPGRDVESHLSSWPTWAEREREVRAAWGGSQQAEHAVAECKAKWVEREQLTSRIALVRNRWPSLSKRLTAQLIPYGELREQFRAAGVPTSPEEIALTRERAVATIPLAQTMRRRYTVLDVIYELGLLKECSERLAASKSYWR